MGTPASSTAAEADEIRRVNTVYHDGAATGYDSKWGIDYGPVGMDQVARKVRKALGREVVALGECLEIGAGTGYFSLNLMRAGLIGRAVCSDISAGMIEALECNARRLDLDVETAVCDAESLPFADGTFDTVLGHAVLHHVPDLERALRECHRVLRPGGEIVFAGEPSSRGDRLAALPKRSAALLAPAWRVALRARLATPGHSDGGAENHRLEHLVDVHSFTPAELAASAAAAGFSAVAVGGEELLANWFGWTSRTLESSADPETVPLAWKRFAFRGYVALQRIDRALLEGRLPAGLFYNLMLAGRRPA